MKTIIMYSLIMFFAIGVTAQTTNMQTLLNNYLNVKNVLVKSDAKKAATEAALFIKTLNEISSAKLQKNEQAIFESSKSGLIKSATKITKTTDVEKQRVAFAELAEPMWKLVKESESISQKVFYDYCPMKKSYWISTQEAIENPYYGSTMLTCGKVSEKK